MSNYKISIYPYATCNYPEAEVIVETKAIALSILEFMEDNMIMAEVRDIEPSGPMHWLRSNYPNHYAIGSYGIQEEIDKLYNSGNKDGWRELFMANAKYGGNEVILSE